MSSSATSHIDGLVALLRAARISVPIGSLIAFVEAVAALDDDPSSIYWAGRLTLVHDERSVGIYDEVFRAWLLGVEPEPVADAGLTTERVVPVALDETEESDEDDSADDVGAEEDRNDDGIDDPVPTPRASAIESLRRRDFAELDDAERAEVDRLLERMRLRVATRRSRRRRPRRGPARRTDDRHDLRRTVRDSLRTEGEILRLRSLRRVEAPRRLVLLVDVSGSMEAYSRALVRFAHVAVRGRTRVEVFTIGTRLTRLTRELTTTDPDAALTRAAAAVPDWSGGTRLGESLRRFNDDWGTKGMARGAVVVVLSDGWDRGEPAELATEMARLARIAHRIVWVNPLRAAPGYAPLARGMAAALPFVDEFVDGHSFDALEHLAEVLASATAPVVGSAAVPSAGPIDTEVTR